jgi:uncharacterized protein with HEPN domain
MNIKSLRVPDFLHILEAMQRIQTYTSGMQEQGFLANQLVQDAVIRNIGIMGEASRNIEMLDPQFASKYPNSLCAKSISCATSSSTAMSPSTRI